MRIQLFIAFIGGVNRLKEGDRIGDVEQHREPFFCCALPNAGQTFIVRPDKAAIRVTIQQSDDFPEFQTGNALRFGIPDGPVDERFKITFASPRDIYAGKRPDEAVGLLCFGQHFIQFIAPEAVDVDDPLQAD